MDKVFNPRSIVYYGASNNITTMGTGQLAILLSGGYRGRVYPVHPTEERVLGLKAYPDIRAVPEKCDLAFLVLPTDIVAGVLDEIGRAGVRAAVVVSGGFREVGETGKEEELARVARRHGIALIGPNCIGVSNFHIGLNTTYYPYHGEPGSVTVISQSGTYSCHIYGHTGRLGMRLSHTVSVGNSAVIDLSDCLEYFADEPNTRAIALYIEGIRDGEKFMRAAAAAGRKKPVVAVYVGGTGAGARAGMSHTGALAGDDSLYDGMFRQSGVLRAFSIEEMLDWCWALSEQPTPPGGRIGVLTNSGGPGASMADSCNRAGLEVPVFSDGLQSSLRGLLPHTAACVNPVDLTYFLDFNAFYYEVPRMLMESDEIDGIVMYGVFGSLWYRYVNQKMEGRIRYPEERIAPVVMGVLEKLKDLPRRYGKPLIVSSFMGLAEDALQYLVENGIPVYPGPERAVGAMAALYRYKQMGSDLEL